MDEEADGKSTILSPTDDDLTFFDMGLLGKEVGLGINLSGAVVVHDEIGLNI